MEKEDEAEEWIPVFRPTAGEREMEAVAEVFRSHWLGPGPKVEEFESRFASRMQVPFAAAVSSCTAALHLACLAVGIKGGDEVLVPSLTFVSTAHAVVYCGATPIFVDSDPHTGNLSLGDVRRKITSRTRAIIPVHYSGRPCPMDAIWKLAEEHRLSVIEDAAHACGACYAGGIPVGAGASDAVCFSFHAVKTLTTGLGGMVTTRKERIDRDVRRRRWMGIDRSTFERVHSEGKDDQDLPRYDWYYEVPELGYQYCMSDIQAAVGLVQLDKLARGCERRRRIAHRYREGLKDLEWIRLPLETGHEESAWHLYPIRTALRDPLRQHLQERKIATSVHYYPIHLHPFYARQFSTRLPVVEQMWRELLSLPIFPDLTELQQDRVIDSIRRFQPSAEAGKMNAGMR